MMLYTESVVDQTDHFADAFVHENFAYSYDDMWFESLQPTSFCLEKSSARKWIFNVFTAFSVRIWLE